MTKNVLHVTIEGLNQNNFLNMCRTNGITIKNYVRLSKSKSSFNITLSNFECAKQKHLFDFYRCDYYFVSGTRFALLKLAQNIGFLLGLIVFALMMFLSLQKLLSIKIECTDENLKKEILSCINANGYNVGKDWKNINTNEVETIIFSSIKNVSNVSAKREGCALLISAESATTSRVKYGDIVAPEDCVVEYIEVANGSAKVKAGDLVKKGQTIVEANNNETEATVKVRVFRQSSVALSQFSSKKQRTGEITKKTLFVWPWQKPNYDFECNYAEYEKEIVETNCSSGILLPIKIVTIKYYNLELAKVSYEEALENANAKALNLVAFKNTTADKILFESHETNGQKFVDCFAEYVIEL